MRNLRMPLAGLACSAFAFGAVAAPVTYNIDTNHSNPAFEADHNGGVSVFKGIFRSGATSGTIVLDKEAGTGTVDITLQMSGLDFGNDRLNDHAKGGDAGMFNVEQFPTATYTGRLVNFRDGAPTAVEGMLTLHGVTRPLNMEINKFLCKPGMRGGEVCGADASASFNRDDFGISYGKDRGFLMGVDLMVQVEASAAN